MAFFLIPFPPPPSDGNKKKLLFLRRIKNIQYLTFKFCIIFKSMYKNKIILKKIYPAAILFGFALILKFAIFVAEAKIITFPRNIILFNLISLICQ